MIVQRHISLLGEDSKCEHPFLTANYLDNLARLGFIEILGTNFLKNEALYNRITETEKIKKYMAEYEKLPDYHPEIEKLCITVTDFGAQFIRACVIDKAIQPRS